MPSLIPLKPFARPIALRLCNQHVRPPRKLLCLRLAPRRTITSNDKPLPEAEKGSSGPNEEQLPHVSEEAAATSKVTGETSPELNQGSPVQEVRAPLFIFPFGYTDIAKVLNRDPKAQDKAPKVMQESPESAHPKGSRQFSTSARHRAQEVSQSQSADTDGEAAQELMGFASSRAVQGYGEGQGHLFGLPDLPLPSKQHIRHRYDPIVEQFTNLLMQDGKLSRAQRVRPSVPLSNRWMYFVSNFSSLALIEHGYDT